MFFADRYKLTLKPKFFAAAFVIFASLKLGLGQLLWAPRIFTFADEYDYSFSSQNPWILLSQILTLLVFSSGAVIFINGFNHGYGISKKYRTLALIWSLLIVFVLLSDWMSGRVSSLEHFIPLLIPIIGAKLLHVERIHLLDKVYYSVGFIIFGGLIAAVVNPKWAFMLDYQSDSALFNLRFVGLLSHSNQTGGLAGLLLIIGLAKSFKFKKFIICCSLITLLIAQSKTSILATFFAFIVWVIVVNWRSVKLAKALVGVAAVAFIFGWLVIVVLGMNAPSNELTTLTGRTQIWDEALKMWQERPFFGGGQNVFNLEFRLKTELTGAASAHNQFLEILATAGLFGALTMTLLVVYMYKITFRKMRMDRIDGAAAALLMFIFVRGITEPSLLGLGIGVPIFSMFSLFLILSIKSNATSNMPCVNS